MPSSTGSKLAAALIAGLLLSPAASSAQARSGELGEAFELERRGRYAVAAERYRSILERGPANLSALLGLERVLQPIGQLDSILPFVDSALALQPENAAIRSLELRVWGKLQQLERLTAAARRWIEAMPGNADPYREWANALSRSGDVAAARAVLEDGAADVGTAVLARDMATQAGIAGDWGAAARHWRLAVGHNESVEAPAVTNMTPAPMEAHRAILNVLSRDRHDKVGGRIAANLLVSWNRPEEGWVILDRSVPDEPQAAVPLLRRFADRAGLVRTREGARARGFAMERIAELSSGQAAQRARLEAASAFADAGERDAVERMLEQIAAEDRGGDGSRASAVASLIQVMAESGRVEEADARLLEWADRLSMDSAADLRRLVSWAWVREGTLDRAETVLGNDSSVAVLAMRGWIALYLGDLRGATDYFRAAGPRTGTRNEVTERTSMIALIQNVRPDSVPALGAALHRLIRGDTAKALEELGEAAAGIPARSGRAVVLAFAGRLAVDREDADRAEAYLLAAIAADPQSASAPAAAYHLARVYAIDGRDDEARVRLESLILEYPASAVVPLARRMLERITGGIPRG
ncbi:MAG: hypothetical protein O7I93_08870 [Gemmatimonadetes bacterium]|nr:hypothetical protein [Gemmatimonadota bacterium]